MRERFFTPRLRVKSPEEPNVRLPGKRVACARAHRYQEQTERTVWQVFEEKRSSLVPRAGPFDGFRSVPAAVSKTCLVRFDNSRYPVIPTAVGCPVEVPADAERVIVHQDGFIAAEHARCFGRGEMVCNRWHHVPVPGRKPAALRNGAPFRDRVLPPAMASIRHKPKGVSDGDRQMVPMLGCGTADGLATVEGACREALEQGVFPAPVATNIPARRRDPTPAVTVHTPVALRLTREPVAGCAGYDCLGRANLNGTHPGSRTDGQHQTLRDAQRP